jgi:glycosyltransferase involved in cell wall biosynthesis
VAERVPANVDRGLAGGTDRRALSIVYLGLNEFPFGLAETQKVLLVARGLVHAGASVTVISRRWGSKDWEQAMSLPSRGTFEGVSYLNASGSLVRPASWMKRRLFKVRGLVGEVGSVVRLRLSGRLQAAIVSSGDFWTIVYYRAISLIFRFPLVIHLVEYYTALRQNGSWKERLDAYLFDRHVYALVDGLLPISEFLIANIERYSSGKPWLKDPCLVDTARFANLRRAPQCTYLLFCGYLGYYEIILFILEAFGRLRGSPDVHLYLVVNGPPAQFAELNDAIASLQTKDRISVFSDLRDEELAQMYLDAYALLIPLRPTVQDRARFPHKIGEYCASGRPIVTTNYGEVSVKFRHRENAYVASEYSVQAFADVITEALDDPAAAERIGARGRTMATEDFNYLRFGPSMRKFLEKITGRIPA